jgi:hypothetical protein
MRASTHDDCITRKVADRLIARLAARRGLALARQAMKKGIVMRGSAKNDNTI